MNYASPFLVFILLCSTIFWYISGRRSYTGPLIEAEVDGSDSDNLSGAQVEKGDEKV